MFEHFLTTIADSVIFFPSKKKETIKAVSRSERDSFIRLGSFLAPAPRWHFIFVCKLAAVWSLAGDPGTVRPQEAYYCRSGDDTSSEA